LNDRSGPLRILLLDDDVLLQERVLVPKLGQFGFEVVTASRAAEMRKAISGRLPDIIVLDVGLPDGNGFDVVRKLRAEHTGLGIVMLTGRSESMDIVRGLTEGADAYLAKPVEIDVLVATLHSVARRLRPPTKIKAVTWRLSSDEWFLLSPASTQVRLSKAERRLLGTLMKRPNEVVLRETLIDAMTDGVTIYDHHRLDMLIYRLRRKVQRELGEPLPLSVVHGTGYVLAI
jgi:DNA-binding response OmpR family regulator